MQPLAVEMAGLLVECVISGGRVDVLSSVDASFAGAATHVSASSAAMEECELADVCSTRATLCVHASDCGALYDTFDALGLQYGPSYRTLRLMWDGDAAVVSRLKTRSTLDGTGVHPADLDDALCSSALIGAQRVGEIRLPFAVDDARLHGAPGELWAVAMREGAAAVSARLIDCLLYTSPSPRD